MTSLGSIDKRARQCSRDTHCNVFLDICIHGACVFCKVEVWLNRVLDSMRSTVRHEMTEAVLAYEDKPREQWLFDYPAQVNRLSGVCVYRLYSMSLWGFFLLVALSNLWCISTIIMSVPPIDIAVHCTHSLMLYVHSLQPDSVGYFEQWTVG